MSSNLEDVRINQEGVEGGTKKTRSLALLARVASLCVVFHKENASTAVPDLDSPTLGLRDREVFLDRVAYCPVQYALRSLTMNRVGILPFLTPAPTVLYIAKSTKYQYKT